MTEITVVRCPYCNVSQQVSVPFKPRSLGRPVVQLCNTDDVPGCDRYFLTQTNWRPVTKVFKVVEDG